MKSHELGLSPDEINMLESIRVGLSKDNNCIIEFIRELKFWHQLLPCRRWEVNVVKDRMNSIILKVCYLYEFSVILEISNFREYVIKYDKTRVAYGEYKVQVDYGEYKVQFNESGYNQFRGKIKNMDRAAGLYDFAWCDLIISDLDITDMRVNSIQSTVLPHTLSLFSYDQNKSWDEIEAAHQKGSGRFILPEQIDMNIQRGMADLDDVELLF